MANCAVCGEYTDLPYTCNFCGVDHCSSHRLPEKHDCPGLGQSSDKPPITTTPASFNGPTNNSTTPGFLRYSIYLLLVLLGIASALKLAGVPLPL